MLTSFSTLVFQFMNAVDESKTVDFVSDIEEIVHRLRRSRESVHTLPSTHHAVLRYLLKKGATDTILKIISDPLNYGIFPDHYTSNLLMDSFLEQGNYTGWFHDLCVWLFAR